jgi:4-hydroxy-tetrahydrodipicolinate synthase
MSLDPARLSTVQLVPLTPFSRDGGTVRAEVLGDFARWLYDAGIRVFLPGAGTGEFHSLSAGEVVSCVRAVRVAVGDDAVVLAPIGLGLAHALAIGRGAIEAGADALLVMPPIHPYLGDSGLRDYFQALMTALPLPFLAYKKGPFPSDELLGELATTGRLVGVKYAVNDVDAVTRFIETYGTRVGVYCGTAERFAPFFHLAGATGYTSGAGNLCPRLTLALHAALAAGKYAQAMKYLRILRPIEDYRARSGDSYNISMLKVGLRINGRDFGPPRPPQRRLNAAEESEIRDLLEPILAAEADMVL